jgi:hypothetical protein
MVAGSWVHDTSVNESRRLADQGPGLARSKGTVASNLERWSASGWLGATPARGAGLRSATQPARSGGSPELALYGAPDLGFLWGFTYGIEAMLRTYFAHLGRTVGNDGSWCGWGGSAQARCRCRRALGLLRLNWRHQRWHWPSVKLLGRSTWFWRAGSGVAMARGGA